MTLHAVPGPQEMLALWRPIVGVPMQLKLAEVSETPAHVLQYFLPIVPLFRMMAFLCRDVGDIAIYESLLFLWWRCFLTFHFLLLYIVL